ncbi:MAG: cytochrome c [Gammaproteobacteria bacterium]|nr:MAG: cytochrome c [Gammaproteobacteria bacterium]
MRWLAFLLLPIMVQAAPVAERQASLINLLRDDCGSCHGGQLNGGLGPSLRAKALATKPDELLYDTIANGREGTAMPPWRNFLNDEEIRWLIKVLRTEQWQK